MWRNTLISDSYEPGSTGKVMTFAAAIEEGVIDADTVFECDGYRQVANYNIKCHNYLKGGCGSIDSLTAIAASCNVAFMEIGMRLGRENFAKYQQLFNFGQKTGIDLPGEASCEGLLYNVDQLNDVELVTNAFGQCYNVTRLQLAAAFCATINGGYYYKPYVVSELLDSDGSVVESYEPVLVRQVVSEETSAVVREALRRTITDQTYGTGGGVQVSDERLIEGISFIAKTGTAQKLPRSDNKYLISVISAVPMDDPQLVLYVTIDEYGGELQADSAPAQYLSGDIWGTILNYIGVYSESDPGPEDYVYEEETAESGADEAWVDGDSIMTNLDGDPLDTPVPPQDDGRGVYDAPIVDPDSVISPDDALPGLP
jgi:stage V sporulation protein D (sporulation-specific penicillin-binding protein)